MKRAGNRTKKGFLTMDFPKIMVYNWKRGEAFGKRKTERKEHILVCLSCSIPGKIK